MLAEVEAFVALVCAELACCPAVVAEVAAEDALDAAADAELAALVSALISSNSISVTCQVEPVPATS